MPTGPAVTGQGVGDGRELDSTHVLGRANVRPVEFTAIRHVAAWEHYRLAGRPTLSIPAQRYLLTRATRP
ncbi:MAG: hypothetical protein WA731_09745 [Pseudonocardiaceae bacterium]|nr:hypothetical protein [Pseudonocardiaceae bacterium]